MAGASVEFVTAPVAPCLTPFVDGYVGYRFCGLPPGLHRGLPSPRMTLIVAIGPPIDVVAQTDAAQPPARYRCVLGGLQASPALVAHDGFGEGIQIELTPLGSRALVGVPAGAIWNASHDLGDVVGPAAGEIWERLQDTSGWPGRFAVIDDVLTRLMGEAVVEPTLARAWRLIEASGGRIPIDHLAARVGWTRQHLARRFAGEFGLSPKLASRVVRFHHARRALFSRGAASVAEVAAACGYYDQAHLDRDFAEFAGCSPTRLLTEEELPFVQDDAAVVGR